MHLLQSKIPVKIDDYTSQVENHDTFQTLLAILLSQKVEKRISWSVSIKRSISRKGWVGERTQQWIQVWCVRISSSSISSISSSCKVGIGCCCSWTRKAGDATNMLSFVTWIAKKEDNSQIEQRLLKWITSLVDARIGNDDVSDDIVVVDSSRRSD